MATRKRPQLGALFGGDGPATDRPSSAARLRAVSDQVDPAAEPSMSAPGRPGKPPAPRVMLDAGTPAPGAGTVSPGPNPWSAGGWLDPLVLAAQYFDFWQSVLDTSRRMVLGATATAIGRPRPDED